MARNNGGQRKRQGRRSYLKSMPVVGTAPGALQEYYRRIRSFGEELPDTKLRFHQFNNLKPVPPAEASFINEDGKKEIVKQYDNVCPRVRVSEVLTKMWQSDFRQGLDRFHFTVVQQTFSVELRRYFSSNSYFYVEIDYKVSKVSRSIIYLGKERAEYVLQRKLVTWVEVISLDSFARS